MSNKQKFYVMKLSDVGSVMSGQITVMTSSLVDVDGVIKKANELTLEGDFPVIIKVDSKLTNKILDENISIDPSAMSLKNPHDLGIEGTTSNEIYYSITKYSKSSILSKIVKNNPDEAKDIINLYSKLVNKAKTLNIKNAEEASLMTAIKKSGAKYAL